MRALEGELGLRYCERRYGVSCRSFRDGRCYWWRGFGARMRCRQWILRVLRLCLYRLYSARFVVYHWRRASRPLLLFRLLIAFGRRRSSCCWGAVEAFSRPLPYPPPFSILKPKVFLIQKGQQLIEGILVAVLVLCLVVRGSGLVKICDAKSGLFEGLEYLVWRLRVLTTGRRRRWQ